MINNTKPIANRIGSGIRLILIQVPSESGKIELNKVIKPMPSIAAPLPKMSYSPKNSPDFSAGIILVKYERDIACMPPWNIPTPTAIAQNCHSWRRNTVSTPIPVYAAIHTINSFSQECLEESLPNKIANGKATICVTNSAITSLTAPKFSN